MANLAFIQCSKEEKTTESGTFQFITSKWKALKKRKKMEVSVRNISLYPDFSYDLITVPFAPSELEHLGKGAALRLCQTVEEIVKEREIEECILPEDMPGIRLPECCSRGTYSGQYLYKSLVNLLFEEIFLKRSIKICELDITIIHGENNQELMALIPLLSPMIKYLTVLTREPELLETEMNRIYADTGLSVRVVSSFKSLAKNVDVIINLSPCRDWKAIYKVNPRAMVINCCRDLAEKTFKDHVMIQGVTVALPQEVKDQLPADFLKMQTGLAVAEMVLCSRHHVGRKVRENIPDTETMEVLGKRFIEDGYCIDGFLGRHGVLKNNDIRLYGT